MKIVPHKADDTSGRKDHNLESVLEEKKTCHLQITKLGHDHRWLGIS